MNLDGTSEINCATSGEGDDITRASMLRQTDLPARTPYARAAAAGGGVERLDQCAQFAPWTTWSISARNLARRVCLLCLSKLALARVICRIPVNPAVAALLLWID